MIANRAQPGIESTVPQTPLELTVRGDCVFARTLGEARGEPSPCPIGTWVAPGGDWSPTAHVAAGDRLELSFPTEQASVDVVGTSNYPVGLRTPDGTPVPNESLGAFATSPTADGRVWVATVPPLDNRARFPTFSAIAVTARESDGRARNVAFRVQTPRSADESTRCGPAHYSASQSGFICPDGGAPPGGGRVPPPGPAPPPSPDPGPAPPPRPDLGLMPSATAGRAVLRVVKPRIGAGCSSLGMLVAAKTRGTVHFRASIAGRTVARWKRTLQPRTTRVQLRLYRAARTRMRRSSRGSIALTVTSGGRVLARRAVSTRACRT